MDFRAMRRFKQQLSQDECGSILTKVYRGFLSVNGEMGYPYTIPMNFVYDNGHIYFHSALQGHKIDAVKSSPNACFTVTCKRGERLVVPCQERHLLRQSKHHRG